MYAPWILVCAVLILAAIKFLTMTRLLSTIFTLSYRRVSFPPSINMAPPKKKSKVDLSHLRSLVHQEKAPAPLTADDIKNMMIPSSFKAHEYTMSLWAE